MNQTMLINPSFLELDDVYRGLPQYDSLMVLTNQAESTLSNLEKIGFVALSITSKLENFGQTTIKGYKGKHGPCHFHGDTANYTGQALAALDDDLHLLVKNKPFEVCEKTKHVLTLPPYQSTVLCQTIEEGHLPNTIKDFEEGISVLLEILKNTTEHSADRKYICYPGPFRLLILQDGTIVRRGICNSVPMGIVEELMKKEGCTACMYPGTRMPEYFQDNYSMHGSLFMQESLQVKPMVEKQSPEADFSQLGSIGADIKKRLFNVIAKQQKYFVLVGSDMADQSGCCPSLEVTDANRLARHGVLSSLREATQGDSCPVTIFAFRDELDTSGSGFTSSMNFPFRKEVEEYLKRKPIISWKPIVKWALLAFVSISLVFAVKQCHELNFVKADQRVMVRLLNPAGNTQVQLILFHNQRRCFQCLEIERQAKEVVEDYFSVETERGDLAFKSIAMDDPQFIGLAERYQLFAATLVIVDFDGENVILEKPLLQTGSLYRDEQAFKTQLKKDIEELLHYD